MSDRDFIPEFVRIGDAALRALDTIELSGDQYHTCPDCYGTGIELAILDPTDPCPDCPRCWGNGGWWSL